MARNVNLDLLRLAFATIIVICHIKVLDPNFSNGMTYLGVEFFFFISGFLMVSSYMKSQSTETDRFIIKKIKSIWPAFLLSSIVALTAKIIVYSISGQSLLDVIFLAINELTGGQMVGIPVFTSTDVAWYLGVMIIALSLSYPLVKYRYCRRILFPVIAMFIYGFMFCKYGRIPDPAVYDGLFFSGMLRGVAAISMGVFAFDIVNSIKNINYTTFGCIIISIVEIITLGFSIILLLTSQNYTISFTILLMMWIGLTIVLSEKSYLHINNNNLTIQKISSHVATISLLLYLNHYYWFGIINYLNPSYDLMSKLLVSTIPITITIVCLFVILYYKEKIKSIIVRLLVQSSYPPQQ